MLCKVKLLWSLAQAAGLVMKPVHLANTLDAELERTNVVAYTIGPGLVPT